jgi:hypothetical protein
MKINKTLLNKIKLFKLTTPVAIIIASIILSFHYVWINKYEFIPNKLGKTSFTVINKWTGEACVTFMSMEESPSITEHIPPLCELEGKESIYIDYFPFSLDIELP